MQPAILEKPERLLFRGFAAVILIGAFLLMTPWAGRDGRTTDPLTALFTATSATCVTGLSVVDVGTHFSGFGQAVILALIQFGGLGIMTVSTFLLILVGRRLTAAEEFAVADYSVGALRIRGLKSLLIWTVGLTVVFESVGALILAGRLASRGMDAGLAMYHGVFHSISAFCNAGFSLYPDSLAGFARDPIWLITLTVLIVAGGLGFLVLYDIFTLRFRRPAIGLRRRLTMHSRIVLIAAAILVGAGAVGFGLLEWGNTLDALPAGDKGCVALFHGVTPRTAGFNVVDFKAVQPATRFMTAVLMFIGGAPCSAAGGIKVTTLVVLLMVIRSLLRGRRETEFQGRTLPTRAVREALTIFLLALLVIGAVFGLLLIMERPLLAAGTGFTSEDLMFETVSAFATVGLSTGVTPCLSEFGRLCIVFLMFVGRLGPLAMALMIGQTKVRQAIRYPEEDLLVG